MFFIDFNPFMFPWFDLVSWSFFQVKTFTYSWIARTSSSGDQLSKDALCGFVAAVVACSVVYPIDSTKARGSLRLNSLGEAEWVFESWETIGNSTIKWRFHGGKPIKHGGKTTKILGSFRSHGKQKHVNMFFFILKWSNSFGWFLPCLPLTIQAIPSQLPTAPIPIPLYAIKMNRRIHKGGWGIFHGYFVFLLCVFLSK